MARAAGGSRDSVFLFLRCIGGALGSFGLRGARLRGPSSVEVEASGVVVLVVPFAAAAAAAAALASLRALLHPGLRPGFLRGGFSGCSGVLLLLLLLSLLLAAAP